jgi:hypothetical protein
MRRAWTTGWRFALRLLAVPIGLAGVLLLGWALVRAILSLGWHTRVGQLLLALGALCILSAVAADKIAKKLGGKR